MSGRKSCGVCGKETTNPTEGLPLCYEHAAVARRLAKVKAAQTDPTVDLIGSRSYGPRDNTEGSYGLTTYDIVPSDDVERVSRDVKVEIDMVPVWAVEALFRRLQSELRTPDIGESSVTLFVKYEMLDESQYERLVMLRDALWVDIEFEVVKTRLYPPKKLMDQKVREVDAKRAELARAEKERGE